MKRQTLLGVLGTLVLGALGSGLWELIKPAFTFAGSFALSVLSLGFDSVVSDIYVRIGRGTMLSALVRALGLMQISLFFAVFAIFRRNMRIFPEDFEHRWHAMALTLLMSICAWGSLFGAMRHAYVANERAHFDNLVRIAAPYMGEEDRLIIDSHLARVSSKAEYEMIVLELKTVLKANKIVGYD